MAALIDPIPGVARALKTKVLFGAVVGIGSIVKIIAPEQARRERRAEWFFYSLECVDSVSER